MGSNPIWGAKEEIEMVDKELIKRAVDKLTEEEYDALATKHYESGIDTGLSQAADIMEEKAKYAYSVRDDASNIFRMIGDDIRLVADKARDDWNKKYQ